MAEIRYRYDVGEEDVEVVRQLTETAGVFDAAEVEVAVELVYERLRVGLKSGYHFLFAEDPTVVGYTCFGPIPCTIQSYDLYWIVVDSSRKRHGYGRALLDRTEATIDSLGGRRIYVETSSRAAYEPTRKFYLATGYRIEATIEDFYAPGDSKVILAKVL